VQKVMAACYWVLMTNMINITCKWSRPIQ